SKMKLYTARIVLFCVWATLLVFYPLLFLLTRQDGVSIKQATESCWKSVYVLLPILTAFGSFWFLPTSGQPGHKDDDKPIDTGQLIAMFVITMVVHLIVVVYFC